MIDYRDPKMHYQGENFLLIDAKHRLVFCDKWRDVLSYRLAQNGFNPENPADRVLTLIRMCDSQKRPYIEVADRIAYAKLFQEILRGENGLDHRNVHTINADTQWRFAIPTPAWEHAQFTNIYAYLVANPARDLETMMIWDPAIAVGAGLLEANHRQPQRRQKNS